MQDVFASFGDYKTLSERVDTLKDPIIGLLQQTIICCEFVREYTARKFPGGLLFSSITILRLIEPLPARLFGFSSTEKISEFESALIGCRENINAGAVIHTTVVTLSMSDKIDDMCTYISGYLRGLR